MAHQLARNGVSAKKLEENHISPEIALAVVADARLSGTLEINFRHDSPLIKNDQNFA